MTEIRYIHNKTHKHRRERALVSDELINDHLGLVKRLLRTTWKLRRITKEITENYLGTYYYLGN